VGSKDTHYCVLTNVVNPMLDGVRFWHWLEWAIEHLLGVSKRPSLEVRPVARQVG
jgi:ubiquitin-conjugating enzyme E2 variant